MPHFCAISLPIPLHLDFLKVLRFSFPVPVVGPSSLLPQKKKEIYRSRFALVKDYELDL